MVAWGFLCYGPCDLTHTATRGLSEALLVTPHDAVLSPRKIADFLVAPQYAVTSTSPDSQLA
jgi:hypothetical protein